MFARAMMTSLVILPLLACAPPAKSPKKSSTAQDNRERERERKRIEKQEEKDQVSSRGKKWGGWRWKGKRGDCFYKFENRCFAKRKDACKAAGCGESDCRHSNSAPAKVQCR